MGMFDTVYIEKKEIVEKLNSLLKEKREIYELQTKDLENMLANYRVKETYLESEDYIIREPKKSETRKIGNMTLPLYVREATGWRKLKYTQTLGVYTSSEKGKWIDVILEFYRGKLMSWVIYIEGKKKYEETNDNS